MSHLLEEYAKNLGVKISLPIVKDHFFPLTIEKYITLANDDDIQSKHYPFYELVLNLLSPFLKNNSIKVVQLGGKSKIEGVDQALNLTFKQQSFLLSNSLLHLGSDNALNHLASAKKIPTVNLFGNTYPEVNRPIFSSPSMNVNLAPKWDKKPCFDSQDPKSQITKIKPEVVAQSVLDLLKITEPRVNFKTLYAGSGFNQDLLEIVPTAFTRLNVSANQRIMLRPDYGLNEDVFLKYFSEYKISSICSDKLIQPQGLQKIANNLQDFFLFIDDMDEDIPENYFRFVKRLGVNLNILSKKEEHVSALRNKYFDIPVRYAYPAREKPCEITEKTRFISRKRIVCEGKEYLSYAHFKKGLDRNNKVLDSPEYWRELDHFYIYESE
jgi:hypothetical protein|tara:strand:+ start:1827 stop:2972 length:1146 start_codon:yes stop_codon:yes gene_type:complete